MGDSGALFSKVISFYPSFTSFFVPPLCCCCCYCCCRSLFSWTCSRFPLLLLLLFFPHPPAYFFLHQLAVGLPGCPAGSSRILHQLVVVFHTAVETIINVFVIIIPADQRVEKKKKKKKISIQDLYRTSNEVDQGRRRRRSWNRRRRSEEGKKERRKRETRIKPGQLTPGPDHKYFHTKATFFFKKKKRDQSQLPSFACIQPLFFFFYWYWMGLLLTSWYIWNMKPPGFPPSCWLKKNCPNASNATLWVIILLLLHFFSPVAVFCLSALTLRSLNWDLLPYVQCLLI